MGSSPRGRGKHDATDIVISVNGLIPARAGKTRARRPQRVVPTAHPRVGGENVEAARAYYNPGGSSPRGRGKRLSCAGYILHLGLIPAWAGKTPEGLLVDPLAEAHPRVGGEN